MGIRQKRARQFHDGNCCKLSQLIFVGLLSGLSSSHGDGPGERSQGHVVMLLSTRAALAELDGSSRWIPLFTLATALLIVAGLGGLMKHRHRLRRSLTKPEREDFARSLIESQESERKRIVGELHDSLEQNLLVIRNYAALALRRMDPQSAASQSVNEILTVSTEAIEEVRTIAANLRPHQLDRLGLTQAVTAMIRNVAGSSQLEIRAKLEPLDRLLPPEFETHLYRIIQESLSNVVKHARAAVVEISASIQDERIHLEIRDDGCGFDPTGQSTSDRSKGFGLAGIAERVRIMGGELVIWSRIGKGMAVQIAIPQKKQTQLGRP